MLDQTIPKIVLDPANEGDLTLMAYDRIKAASGGVIRDFRPGSAVASLVEGQTFALAELLYYLNLMPEAIAVEVFRLYGVTRSLGTKASGELTFMLSDPAGEQFTVPAGYRLAYLDNEIETLEPVVIPAGGQETTVAATMVDVGSSYNAQPFDVAITSPGLGLVSSVFNRAAFTGGSDLEPLETLIARCQAATVSRQAVITKLDYERFAQSIIGVGSRAVAVPDLAADGTSYRRGNVALFLLDATGQPASATTCQQVVAEIKPRVLLGTGISCLPAVLVPLQIEITANTVALSETVAEQIIENVRAYLDPASYDGGDIVHHNEIEYQARVVPGVRSVDAALINGDSIDYLLPQIWHYPSPSSITVYQIDINGATLTTSRGFDGVPLAEDE